MTETYNKYKDQGLEFVAVAMSYDPPNYVLNYAQTRKLPFTVALDSGGDLAKQFGDVAMTPTTFVIGKGGVIQHIDSGGGAVDPSGALEVCALPQRK